MTSQLKNHPSGVAGGALKESGRTQSTPTFNAAPINESTHPLLKFGPGGDYQDRFYGDEPAVDTGGAYAVAFMALAFWALLALGLAALLWGGAV